MATFETREHKPEDDVVHSDINYDFLLAQNEDDPTRGVDLWFVVDDYAIRVTDESCQVRLSRIVNDPTDHIGIKDDRDDTWWSWFRGDTENFDDILNSVGGYAEVHMTRYPRPDYVAAYILRLTADLEELTGGSE